MKKNWRKIIYFISVSLTSLIILQGVASAHVVVQPSQVGIASFQIFTVNVPTEKDNPTVALKLLIPSGLDEVIPTVKSGWQINTKSNSKGDITEIDWTGGSIPPNLRDDFTFSAQVPASPTELKWKAYQTYQDGSVVAWDATPSGSDDANGNQGPYSITKVVNDLTLSANNDSNNTLDAVLGIVAIVIATLAFIRTFSVRRR